MICGYPFRDWGLRFESLNKEPQLHCWELQANKDNAFRNNTALSAVDCMKHSCLQPDCQLAFVRKDSTASTRGSLVWRPTTHREQGTSAVYNSLETNWSTGICPLLSQVVNICKVLKFTRPETQFSSSCELSNVRFLSEYRNREVVSFSSRKIPFIFFFNESQRWYERIEEIPQHTSSL